MFKANFIFKPLGEDIYVWLISIPEPSWVLTVTYPGTPWPFCHGILSTYALDFCQNSKPPPPFVLPKGIISPNPTPFCP